MAESFLDTQEIDKRFTYHAPHGDQPALYETLRSKAKSLATFIMLETPPSREQSLAITKLEECIMWANAGIARRTPKPISGGSADEVPTFGKELTGLLNRHSKENASNTPDFILAEYLINCLKTWNMGIYAREKWYGRASKV